LFIWVSLCLAVFACGFPAPTPTPLVIPPSVLTQVAGTLTAPTSGQPSALLTHSPTSAPAASLAAPNPPNPTTPRATAPIPTIAYQPYFEPADCAFSIPQDTDPECGYLMVPENRFRPGSASIRLHVAIFHSSSPNPAPDPVVHLAGGPGGSSLNVAGYLFQQGLVQILKKHDFILFDQRGTGFSQPRLDCPEREALAPTLLEGHLPPSDGIPAILDAFQRCHDRLVSDGIDLSAYNSAESAADVNDLRLALGYEKLDLYGVSYGTRLALTILRDHPEAVRSVVLDSTYPPQVNLYTALAPNADRAFNVLFEHCAADNACNTAYPNLKQVFFDLVDRLNETPINVTLNVNSAERMVRLDGGLMVDVLFTGLYNAYVAAYMPKMIYAIQGGNFALLRQRLELYFDTSSALGMQTSVQCSEEIPFSQPEDAYSAARGVQPQIAAYYSESVQPLYSVCQVWGLPPPDPRENQAVASNIPTLVQAGEYDPITPPEWGRLAAATLSQSYFFEYPGNGHWVTRSSECALRMALAFWDDPHSPPDASCIQEMRGLKFVR
jgi:pimeloyl-ACP methyl ester carboxylesterase